MPWLIIFNTDIFPFFREIKIDLVIDLSYIDSLTFFYLPVTVRGVGIQRLRPHLLIS